MKSIIFGMFAVIVAVIMISLSDGAMDVNANINDRYVAQF